MQVSCGAALGSDGDAADAARVMPMMNHHPMHFAILRMQLLHCFLVFDAIFGASMLGITTALHIGLLCAV